MKDQTEGLTPVNDKGGLAVAPEEPPAYLDLLTLCEIWRALDFEGPGHCDCGKEDR